MPESETAPVQHSGTLGLTLGEVYDAYMGDPTRDWSPTRSGFADSDPDTDEYACAYDGPETHEGGPNDAQFPT